MKKSSGRKPLRKITRENVCIQSKERQKADATAGSIHKRGILKKKRKAKRKQVKESRRVNR
jgi:hypothetical protein